MTVFLKLKKSLSAHATRSGRLNDKLTARVGSDGHSLDRDTRILGAGGIKCGTLSTDACKGGILLIGTDEHLAVIQFQCRSDLEFTVGRIRVRCGLTSHVN